MTNLKTEKLINSLQQEINWISQLTDLLSKEKIALTERRFEELEALAQQKESLAKQIEQSAGTRIELLEISSHKNNAKLGLQTFLSQCTTEETAQITQLNSQLSEKLVLCRELNSVNGQVIATNLNTRQELINILTGQSKAEAINTYTATGDVKSMNESSRHQEA
jgi:flagella synthesis protein FlgN